MTYGYLTQAYADASITREQQISLPHSGAIVMKKKIVGTPYYDAHMLGPRFFCHYPDKLASDMELINKDVICLSLVTEPFCQSVDVYKNIFNDKFELFKQHVVVDLSKPLASSISRHHRYYGRRASKKLCVSLVEDKGLFCPKWQALYQILKERHQLSNNSQCNNTNILQQLLIPDSLVFKAMLDDEVIAAQWWFCHDKTAYSHLTVANDLSYKHRAQYALYWHAIQFFQEHDFLWLDLGSNAGLSAVTDGLMQFKSGWSPLRKPVYLCGKIFDKKNYYQLCGDKNTGNYFPAYRQSDTFTQG